MEGAALEGPTLSDNCAVSVSASSAFFGVGTDLAFPKTIELHKRVSHPRAELPPLEARLPLLHEGGAALAIIGAVEAGAAGARDCPEGAGRRGFQNIVDGQFVGGGRQRAGAGGWG